MQSWCPSSYGSSFRSVHKKNYLIVHCCVEKVHPPKNHCPTHYQAGRHQSVQGLKARARRGLIRRGALRRPGDVAANIDSWFPRYALS
eukprot:5921583-Amphidinium_carterae.1